MSGAPASLGLGRLKGLFVRDREAGEQAEKPVRNQGPGEDENRLRRILLVEDSTTLSLLYQQYLKQAGFDVTAVANGRDAIRALAEGPSAVALDLGLPDIDGLSILKHIQALESPLRPSSSPAMLPSAAPSRPCALAPSTIS